MRITISLDADDFLKLERTKTPPGDTGRLQFDTGLLGEPYAYLTADECDKIADHFAILASRARRETECPDT